MFAGKDLAEVESVIDAVVTNGSDKWYEIGLKLGLKDTDIMSGTHSIPTPAGKLRKVIELKRRQCYPVILETELLRACRTISSPIIGAVEDDLEKR